MPTIFAWTTISTPEAGVTAIFSYLERNGGATRPYLQIIGVKSFDFDQSEGQCRALPHFSEVIWFEK